jgi:rRNA maturation endonuclease Nob1
MLKNGRRCHHCEALNHENAWMCNMCAQPLRKNLKKVARERVVEVSCGGKICPKCDVEFTKNAIFCKDCGGPLIMKRKQSFKKKGMMTRLYEAVVSRAD